MSALPNPKDLLTPGGYMKACRLKAGVTVRQCGLQLAPHFGGQSRAVTAIENMEANHPGDYSYLVTLLTRLRPFAFEFGTFARLAAASCDPVPDEWAEA
jgi:hypothetical protein